MEIIVQDFGRTTGLVIPSVMRSDSNWHSAKKLTLKNLAKEGMTSPVLEQIIFQDKRYKDKLYARRLDFSALILTLFMARIN